MRTGSARSTRISDWKEFDERTAAGLCYTSGTTGNPEGRALFASFERPAFDDGDRPRDPDADAYDSVLPVVPMFHANSWGLALACLIRGARMVMPGPRLDGASVYDLLETEKVTMTAAVPTVWLGLLHYLRKEGKTALDAQARRDRRLGLSARHDSRLRGRLRRRSAPRLGHDRNEPARLGRLDQAKPDVAVARGEARPSGEAGLGAVRRRDEDRRRREQRRCRGTASASAGSR